jgi:hypothetical protein
MGKFGTRYNEKAAYGVPPHLEGEYKKLVEAFETERKAAMAEHAENTKHFHHLYPTFLKGNAKKYAELDAPHAERRQQRIDAAGAKLREGTELLGIYLD